MSPASRPTSVRSIRRSVRRSALKEYVGGALWVLPSLAALLALVLGYGVSQIEVPPGSPLNRLAFQGTSDDARVRPVGHRVLISPEGQRARCGTRKHLRRLHPPELASDWADAVRALRIKINSIAMAAFEQA
jgi:hypothetical protein